MRYWFSAVLALAGCIEDVPVPDLRSPDAHVFPMDAVVDAGRVTIRDRGSVDFSPMPPPTDAPTTPISAARNAVVGGGQQGSAADGQKGRAADDRRAVDNI